MYEAKKVHPIVYVCIFVFGHTLFQAIINPNLEFTQRAFLFTLALLNSILACLFEYMRLEEEEKRWQQKIKL